MRNITARRQTGDRWKAISEQRHSYAEAVTPRPMMALTADALAAIVAPCPRSRGLIVIAADDLSTIIDAWRFSSFPLEKELTHQVLLTSLIDQRTRWLSIAGSRDGDEVTWRFDCPAVVRRCSGRVHSELLWPLADTAGDVMYECPGNEPRRPQFVVPTRILAAAEPDGDAP